MTYEREIILLDGTKTTMGNAVSELQIDCIQRGSGKLHP
jgi:hypothetical protein